MEELTVWLRAQLDEDERVASGGGVEGDGHWECTSTGVLDLGGIEGFDGVVQGPRDAIYHMARHDPARVLAEVEAKRRILDEHDPDWPRLKCPMCCSYDGNDNYGVERRPREAYPCRVVRLLALPYAGQSGYQEEWRP